MTQEEEKKKKRHSSIYRAPMELKINYIYLSLKVTLTEFVTMIKWGKKSKKHCVHDLIKLT